jgi:hypothetical protein
MQIRRAQVAAAVLSVVAALTIVETTFRVSRLFGPPAGPQNPLLPELFEPNDDIGYRLRPSRHAVYRYPATSPEALPLVSNSDGFRSNRELDERDDRLRILVVGDSLVFGSGVRAEDRLTEQLESLEPRWRVDNMGMPGWGLDLMVRAIERFGPKAHPAIVVLGVYTDDFRRVVPYYAGAGYAYPKFELSGHQLITVPFPSPSFWERPRVVQFLIQSTWKLRRDRYNLNGALLDRYVKDAATIGFRPVVVFLPGSGDTQEDKQRRNFLAHWAAEHSVAYLDLSEPLHRADLGNIYLPNNPHWNAAGHRIVAGQLRNGLRRLVDVARDRPEPDGRPDS